ncbi:hypothetical protein A7U60_g5820 [Sanghuangporus baumii]|uniref:Uncharacterized protein n=1 Tax=Sanghuangporus baumii TaxID=108892 RepID=A0A9Q5HW37_SANBA|nr:hypothetical protein A7U60_g5820 [Sanghuangporus baumii]
MRHEQVMNERRNVRVSHPPSRASAGRIALQFLIPVGEMFYDPRMRGLGRGIHKTRKRLGRGVQDVFAAADMKSYDDDTNDVGDLPGVRMMNEDVGDLEANSQSTALEASETQTRLWSAGSLISQGSCPPADAVSISGSGNGWSMTSSTGLVDPACGTSSLRTNGVFQTAMAQITDSSSSSLQSSYAASEQQNETTAVVLSGTSTGHNTWITATSDEASSSGVTIMPFITLRKANSTSSTINSLSITGSAISSTSDLHSSSVTTSSAFQSMTSAPVSVPRVVHVDGVSPLDKAGTIAGITVGIAIVLLIIVLAILAYVRGGRIRGLSSDIHFPPFRSARRGSPMRQNYEGSFPQHETSVISPDVEHGTTASGSRRTEEKERWEDVDLRDVRRSNTKGDDVRWLEAWCRDKEKMMARPPELRFNPDLPLPPIILEGARRNS